MADFGISIVEKLIEVIGSELIKQICSGWGYKSELEKLEKTIITIKAVLVDAEAKRDDLSMAQRVYVSDLKDAVYVADDLFDELFTLATLNEIDGNRGRKLFEKVGAFFSSKKNKLTQAKLMSRRVKKIRKQLDTAAEDYNKFGLSINYTPIVRRRDETCSYVDVKNIIGRDSDQRAILEVLLDDPSATDDDFCLLSIVGVGGLGKTALAQLVYQHIKNIQNGFLSLWVCVSDQEGEQFDVKTILCKILESVDMKLDSSSSMEFVKNRFQERFREVKYFLVLDDLWNEDRKKWIELESFLRMGQGGSKIVVTTRSEKTASSIGSKHVHKLKGLFEEDSRCLFEIIAFGEREKDEELVKIGENIVKKCCNNPLAIKVIGSLLHGQERSKWESIENSGLGEIKEGSDHILHTLKLSYYNLTPSLKSCFSYCAIFPKDFRMHKGKLIDYWLAQGYIVSLDGGQSLDDAAEEYFLILLRRCFFQDVKKNEYGDIESVKMHDLIHDIAQEVSKEEICVVNSETKNVGEKVRHLIDDSKYEKHIVCSAKIRSYISIEGMADKEVENMTALRTLYVVPGVETLILPSLHNFLLLRYVHLCDSKSKSLPDSFTRLYNLQTLVLYCSELKELPEDFGNLINLRHLDISKCYKLVGMPLGIDKFTNLRILPCFVVGNGNSNAKLKVLQSLNKIKGGIDILIRENYEHVDDVSDTEGGYLIDMKHLTYLIIEFKGECINPEGLMKKLQPPPNLIKSFKLESYNGKTIQWFAISPQHQLVRIEIRNCGKLEQIPVLSKLPHLKSLLLDGLNSVEYMEEGMSNSNDDAKEVVDFFPSLESLEIWWMEELKGWWKEGGMRLRFPRLSFLIIGCCDNFKSFVPYLSLENLPEHQCPSLCTLYIWSCPKFVSNLVCPSLENLDLKNINERLLITCGNYQVEVITKPRDVFIRQKVSHLKSLRINGVTTLTLYDCSDSEVESFVEFKEELNQISCASSLQTLNIEYCQYLKRLLGLESLTALQELSLEGNANLSINEDDEEPWKSFRSLCKLKFEDLSKMKSLPKGMQHLTSLQSLDLIDCDYLEELPQWMSCLSSLQDLYIDFSNIKSFPEAMKDLTSLNTLSLVDCPYLHKICKNPDGEEFQSIKHIPNITTNVDADLMSDVESSDDD